MDVASPTDDREPAYENKIILSGWHFRAEEKKKKKKRKIIISELAF